jgi:hypothetical protein
MTFFIVAASISELPGCSGNTIPISEVILSRRIQERDAADSGLQRKWRAVLEIGDSFGACRKL